MTEHILHDIQWEKVPASDGGFTWSCSTGAPEPLELSPEFRDVRRFCVWAAVTEEPDVLVPRIAQALGATDAAIWQDLHHLEELGYVTLPKPGQTGFQILVEASFHDEEPGDPGDPEPWPRRELAANGDDPDVIWAVDPRGVYAPLWRPS